MSMEGNAVLSIMLNAELDSLGFKEESVKRRAEMFKKRSKAKAAASQRILGCDHKAKIIVGSRRDGIAIDTSDTDVLLINNGIHCSSETKEFENEDTKVCLHLEYKDAPPGYAFLSLCKYAGTNGEYFKDIEESTEFRNDRKYLSSEKYIDKLEKQQRTAQRGWFGRVVNFGERKGPSIPKTIDALGFEADLVGAFTASCKRIIRKWQNKKRKHDWPSDDIVDTAASCPLYVVAVGQHGCRDENLLWRISFNNAETVLVHSMNDSQTKLLVMMKLLAKNVLTPICSDITSYVIKNVVFHVSEQHPLLEFNKQTLVDRLRDCLEYLRHCIEIKLLPNYMNEEGNLFQGKLTDETIVADAIQAIDDIIKNGRETFLFYLENKMRPGIIGRRYPRLLPIRQSLMKGYLEDMFAQKKVQSMSLDQLINFHVKADICASEVMLFMLEIYYVYIPFYFKYGFTTLKSDICKVRSVQNQMKNAQGNPKAGEEDFEIIEETDLFEREEVEAQVTEDIEHVGGMETEDNELPEENWRYVAALLYVVLLKCSTIIKYMLLHLFDVLHLVCVVFTFMNMRTTVIDDSVWFVDILGISWITVIGVSVIQKRIAPILNLVYVILLMSFWRVMMSYTDQYTLYFQELYVMLDPRQQRLQNFRTADFNMDEMEYYNNNQQMYA